MTFLEMKGITKAFPGVLANDHVDLDVEAGEIHSLLGENGAGKTTLMNILYGLYQPDEGEIFLNGEKVEIRSPNDAIANRIGMVHQHFMVVEPLSVAENIILGMENEREPLLDLDEADRAIAELSHQYNLDVDPQAKIWQLSVGIQQRVEIIKALYRGADLLILDEPTSSLTPQGIEELFDIMRRLKGEGHAVIFISHKLDEVMKISDRVTVLRGGNVVATVDTSETSKKELARLMVGREVLFRVDKADLTPGESVLDVADLWVHDDREEPAVRGISFKVHRHEVLGIAGIEGNGQREMVEAISGLRPIADGVVKVTGGEIVSSTQTSVSSLTMAHIPEDRLRHGLVLDFTCSENLVSRLYAKRPFARLGLMIWERIRDFAQRLIGMFDIRTPGPEIKVRALSGGNQQKVVLARELSREPDLILANQPTRGLDVGASEFTQQRILDQRERGAGILYVSTELDQVRSLSDRIAVFHRGEIMGVVEAEEASTEELGLMMAGERRLEAA